VAEIVTGVVVSTAAMLMVKSAWVAPAGTTALAGTAATAGLEVANATVAPPAGAGPVSDTLLLVVEPPPVLLAGDAITPDNAGGVTVNVAVFVTPA